MSECDNRHPPGIRPEISVAAQLVHVPLSVPCRRFFSLTSVPLAGNHLGWSQLIRLRQFRNVSQFSAKFEPYLLVRLERKRSYMEILNSGARSFTCVLNQSCVRRKLALALLVVALVFSGRYHEAESRPLDIR